MDNSSNLQTVRSLNRRKNTVVKERVPSGAWEYSVLGADGTVLAKVVFETGRDVPDKLTNSDLLEIVRDRLSALNRSNSASFRSYNCAQHVYEALFWADLPANKPGDKLENEITPEDYHG